MFSAARSAAAGSASPMRQVFEFAHTHTHLVGLGLLIPPPSSSLATLVDIPGNIRSGSSQPMRHRPPPARIYSHCAALANPPSIPHAPRLHGSAVLPPVFSPMIGSPSSVDSPLPEGYFSDDEEVEEAASGTQPMNMYGSNRHCFASTTNSSRSSFRNPRSNAHLTTQEVERVGLGISGLTLSSLNPNRGASNVRRNDFAAVNVPEKLPPKTSHSHPIKTVGFITNVQIIGSPVEDGYAADTEFEDLVELERHQSCLSGSALSGPRSCRSRQKTPFYAPNGELSWL